MRESVDRHETSLRLVSPEPDDSVHCHAGWRDGHSRMSVRGIFICYRREDSQGEAGRIDDRLRPRYGSVRVFRDVYSSPIGTDFPDHLVRTVAACSVMIVVIGRRWLESLLARPERPDDWLRIEIRTALGCPGLTVIPVLVQGAVMPRPRELPDDIRALSTIGAHELSDSRWDYDMKRLLAVLDELVGPVPDHAESAPESEEAVQTAPRRTASQAETNRATAAAWVAGIVLMSGIGIGLIPAIVAARADLTPELYAASLAGAVLWTAGAAAACVNLLLLRMPPVRVAALGLLVVGTMLLSIGAGAVLRSASGGPPGGPDGHPWPPPDGEHGPPPDGPPGGRHDTLVVHHGVGDGRSGLG